MSNEHNGTFWCQDCGTEGQNPVGRDRPMSFLTDGGNLGRGAGPSYIFGPVNWRGLPELRCPCRLEHERLSAAFYKAAKLSAWEACAGRRTPSAYKAPEPPEEDSGWDDEY